MIDMLSPPTSCNAGLPPPAYLSNHYLYFSDGLGFLEGDARHPVRAFTKFTISGTVK
jgi:hypothetical protein